MKTAHEIAFAYTDTNDQLLLLKSLIEAYGEQEYARGLQESAKIAEEYIHHDGDHMTEIGRLIRGLKEKK